MTYDIETDMIDMMVSIIIDSPYWKSRVEEYGVETEDLYSVSAPELLALFIYVISIAGVRITLEEEGDYDEPSTPPTPDGSNVIDASGLFRKNLEVPETLEAPVTHTSTVEEITKVVTEILERQLCVDGSDPSYDIEADMGADSLDIIEIIMELEEHYLIEISDYEAEQCSTIEDIVIYLYEKGC